MASLGRASVDSWLGKAVPVRGTRSIPKSGFTGSKVATLSVAQEWGAVGLVLWILWSVTWLRRQYRAVSSSRPSDAAAAGIVLLGWVATFLVVLFFSGFQVFQNYVSNAYFWLLSGVIFALPIDRGASVFIAQDDGRRRDVMSAPWRPSVSKTLSPPEVADAATTRCGKVPAHGR